jgi:ribonuclease HI
MELRIYCDGGARNNPGPAASAFIAMQGGKVVYKESLFLGAKTNNIAEYTAVILALKWIKNINGKFFNEISFFLDSELVVKQLSGRYRVKSKNLLPLVLEIKKLENKIGLSIRYSNIPRSKNAHADALVNKTIDENI